MREELIRLLAKYKKLKGHEITVVFDGWKAGGLREETFITEGVKVIYSRLGEKADAVIKKSITREKKEWIVISSDRDVMAYTWSQGFVPVASEKFQSLIENADRNLTGEYDLLYEDESDIPRKRGSRTPSRKEKALLRILKKL
jgi:predicted RNA-binding protein with PIN domain